MKNAVFVCNLFRNLSDARDLVINYFVSPVQLRLNVKMIDVLTDVLNLFKSNRLIFLFSVLSNLLFVLSPLIVKKNLKSIISHALSYQLSKGRNRI